MTLRGCCCCGLRGGAKSVGVLFLVITLLELVSVIIVWAVSVNVPTNVQGFGINTPEGQVGVQLRETKSVLRGSGADLELNLGSFGKFGISGSEDGRVSLRTPGGRISSDGKTDDNALLDGMAAGLKVLLISYTCYILLAVSFNSMLIHGTNADSTCAVLAWLVFYGIVFVCWSLASVGSLVTMGMKLGNDSIDDTAILPLAIGGGVGLALCGLLWFWWAVVLAFYRELRDGTNGYKYQRDVSLHEPPAPRPAAAGWKAEACA